MIDGQIAEAAVTQTKRPSVKCVVWDLDNTLWDGILLEDTNVVLKPHVLDVIKTLDSRGILHSIASRNDHDTAIEKLSQLGLRDYFLFPQINWNSKAASIQNIAKLLNIGIDTFAFVDDQPFERDEVAFMIPEILCIDAQDIDTLVEMPEMQPRFITEDSKLRRTMYQSDVVRKQVEEEFVGSNEEFLATINLAFTIAAAKG